MLTEIADESRIGHFVRGLQLAGLISDAIANLQDARRDKLYHVEPYAQFAKEAEQNGDLSTAALFRVTTYLTNQTRVNFCLGETTEEECRYRKGSAFADCARTLPDLSVIPAPSLDWLMAVFSGYFDDSRYTTEGPRTRRMFVAAGYVAQVGGWVDIERKWDAFLENNHIPYLHMKEFGPGTGAFESFKDDEVRRKKILSEAAEILRYIWHGATPFSCVVYLDHLARFNKQYKENIDPYALTIASCRGQIARQAYGQPVECYFDKRENTGKMCDLSDKYLKRCFRLLGNTVTREVSAGAAQRDMTRLYALQCADFLAYEVRRYFSHQYHLDRLAKKEQARKSFKALIDIRPANLIPGCVRWDYPALQWLAAVCNTHGA